MQYSITGSNTTMPTRNQSGFNLIELMIVVVIISLLAAISYPSYTRYVVESRRTDAQAALLRVSGELEKFMAQCNTYIDVVDSGTIGACSGLGHPDLLSDGRYYTLSVVPDPDTTNSISTSYLIIAAPVAGTSQARDGAFRLSSLGVKSWDKSNDGTFAATENTWSK